MTSLRLPIIAASFVLVFVALAGGYWVYQKYGVQIPVGQKIMATGLASGVEWVDYGKEARVHLKYVPDLRRAYGELKKAAGKNVTITLVDKATPALESLYQEIEPAVYEAAALSNFTSLSERVNRVGAEACLDSYAVQVDDSRIYIKLCEGDAFLYRIVLRSQPREA